MRKSPFDICLLKVAGGDLSFLSKLGEGLYQRLCYLPIVEMTQVGGTATVKPIIIQREHHNIIPLFTTESRFKEWAEFVEHKGEVLSLFGSDVCAVLGRRGILIDPLTDLSVELSPEFVQEIGNLSSDTIGEEVENIPSSLEPQEEIHEELSFDEPLPHEGSSEAFHGESDSVSATIVTDTKAISDAIQSTDTAEIVTQQTAKSTKSGRDPLLNALRGRMPRQERSRQKRSFFGFFRNSEK